MAILASIVVPVYNGEDLLAHCLRALDEQNIRKDDYEVIVVVDGSTDSSASVAEHFNVRVLELGRRRGSPAARNLGIRAARGTWVALTDHDCIPTRSWLRTLLFAVKTNCDGKKTLGAAGRTLGYRSYSPAARFVDMIAEFDAGRLLVHPKFPFAPASNVMYRREALEMVGGFDDRYCDYYACDLHYRLLQFYAGQFFFEPRAVVFHHHPTNWPEYCRHQFECGRGYGQFMLHHKDQVQWSLWHEFSALSTVAKLGLAACKRGNNNNALIRQGNFLKHLAQRLGFISTFYNPLERRRWKESN